MAAMMAVPALAGCTESADDCSDDEAWNVHEARCAKAVDPSTEVCHAWLTGAVEDDEGELVCQARSDGRAWLDVEITTSEPFPVEVRDGSGLVVFRQPLQFPGSFELSGARGGWTLSVDFDDVSGSGSVVLWG
jgi:hypothetical protein